MRTLLCIALFAYAISCKSSDSRKIDPRVLTVPAFYMQLLDSMHFIDTRTIPAGQPTIVMYFDPKCKFSQQQTQRIISNYAVLKNIRFYMCSESSLNLLNAFSNHYQLSKYRNITVGRDYNLFFQDELKVPSYPWLFIYAADRKLKRIVTGSADVKTILDILKD